MSLLLEFERALSVADSLVAIGYSFRDDHINEVIRRWIVGDEARHIDVIDPSFPKLPANYDNEEPKTFRQELLWAYAVKPDNPRPWRETPKDDLSSRLEIRREPALVGRWPDPPRA